ncbi:MAG: SIS domain-containing protein, partial [Vulcanimicrobiaceae bacterium]
KTLVVCSQSGRSPDALAAVEALEPQRLIALTNDPGSPLAARADLAIALDAGIERAVPASKTVSATMAILLWGAALVGGASDRGPRTLCETADAIEIWLAGTTHDDAPGAPPSPLERAAERLALRHSVALVGAGYGVPLARELALKLKEASYLHAEGFSAGEFRHGSAAILDAGTALIGIVDEASRALVARPLAEAEASETLRYTLGAELAGIERLGPVVGEAFNTLAWLVTGQMLALGVGRARGIDSDRPRGLHKLVE